MSLAPDIRAGATSRIDFRSFAVTVRRIERIGENFLRVTLGGDELADFHFAGLDLRIKLVLPTDHLGVDAFPRDGDWYQSWRALPDDRRNPLRTYTVRSARPQDREFDVDFVSHGDAGPATRWVNRASVGDELLVIGPDAATLVAGDDPIAGVEFRPGAATRILLAGDETAAPAICSILEALPATAGGQAFIEVQSVGDIQPVSTAPGVSVTWLARDARPALGHGEALDRAVRAWMREMAPAREASLPASDPVSQPVLESADGDPWDVPESATGRDLYAWIAGESSCITALRRFLVRETGLDRRDVAFMGYWRRGRAGLG